ncbi:hypothetical protein BH23BAC1_BH23BAC1_50190 [soil metagenome]
MAPPPGRAITASPRGSRSKPAPGCGLSVLSLARLLTSVFIYTSNLSPELLIPLCVLKIAV